MTINAEKTKAMLITTRQKRRFLPNTALDLFLQGERLSTVNIEELLGVLIDSNLSWKPRIQKVEKLVASNLALQARKGYWVIFIPYLLTTFNLKIVESCLIAKTTRI